jgi:hypothetical protein
MPLSRGTDSPLEGAGFEPFRPPSGGTACRPERPETGGPPAVVAVRKSSSQRTRCWRELDSNSGPPWRLGRSAPRKSRENSSAVRAGTARDTVSLQPGLETSKLMPEAEIAKAVQLLDLMLEFFADDGHWTRGRYDDGNGGHCLVGAVLHLSRKHCLPKAPAIALLQDAMPRPGLSACALQRPLLRQRRRAALHNPHGPPSC